MPYFRPNVERIRRFPDLEFLAELALADRDALVQPLVLLVVPPAALDLRGGGVAAGEPLLAARAEDARGELAAPLALDRERGRDPPLLERRAEEELPLLLDEARRLVAPLRVRELEGAQREPLELERASEGPTTAAGRRGRLLRFRDKGSQSAYEYVRNATPGF